MKSKPVLSLLVFLLFSSLPLQAEMRCDFNGDGNINIFDLLAFLKHMSGTEKIVGAEKDFVNPKPDTVLVVDTVTVSDTVGVYYYFSQLPDTTKHPLFGSWEIYKINEKVWNSGSETYSTFGYLSPDASGLLSFSETSATTSNGEYAISYRVDSKGLNTNQAGTYKIQFNILLMQDSWGDSYSQVFKITGNDLEFIFGDHDQYTFYAKRASP